MAGSQVAWGLDVGTTSLKAIKLRRDGDRVAIEAFDVVEHDKFLSEPDIDRDEVIRKTLQKFLERQQIRRDTVIIGVPGSSTFARFVKLPPVEPKKIPEIVRFEAIQQIPFPLDQVNWDYQTFQAPDSPDVEVGIFAMKKDLVTQVMANFQASAMTVHGVQMSPLAVYNAVIYDGLTEDKGTVILDIGAEHTDLVVADQGRLWIRTINIGGNNFTDALAKSFKQPFARAEQLKRSAATSKYAKQIFQAMRPVFADLVAEIQRSIGHYNSSHRDSRLERILGLGNPFKLPNLQKYLQQELKMEVVRVEGFKRANTDGRLAAGLSENILSLTTAYGLALQGLGQVAIDTSLLPVEIARQMIWRQKRVWFMGATAAVVVGVAALGLRAWSDSSAWAAADPARLAHDLKIGEANKLASEFRNQSKSFDNDRLMVESFVKLADHRQVWPELLTDIYSSLPQAKNAPNADPKRFIAIQSVESVFSSSLSSVTRQTVAGGANAAPMASIVSSEDGGEGMGMPTPAQPAPGAPGSATPGSSDRGYLITIKGYTPYGRELVVEFQRALEGKAPENGKKKPYFFGEKSFYYFGDTFPSMPMAGAPASAIPKGVWGGGTRGSFWNIFVPDMMGIEQPQQTPGMPGMGAMSGFEGGMNPSAAQIEHPLDAMFPKPASTKDPHYLYGAYMFTLTFKVHVR